MYEQPIQTAKMKNIKIKTSNDQNSYIYQLIRDI